MMRKRRRLFSFFWSREIRQQWKKLHYPSGAASPSSVASPVVWIFACRPPFDVSPKVSTPAALLRNPNREKKF